MRQNKLSWVVLPIFVLGCFMMARPCEILAKELPPHLIQTVTQQDIYEGMAALGFLESAILEEENCEEAYENVKNCVVRIQMGNAHGSGVIWDMSGDRMVIATNKHVLEYWNSEASYVHFPDNVYTTATVAGISKDYDIGFLEIDCREFAYEILEQMRYVHWDMKAYEQMQPEDDVFLVGAVVEGDSEELVSFHRGSIGDMWQYIEAFEEYMIYGYGQALPGMSGGGTFDAKGNFIGMISGGTTDGETASVPLPVILEAYAEIEVLD
ncbi:MAG: serine protease [Blautia sp.]|nr:serine protease [Lachnoclostridium sp.]MCM1210291.1 serine protease [Blautia sp.]